jgi:hypothetical protein
LPGFAAVLGILALYLCALNSKEIAPTLPILILVYEWIYHRPESLSARALGSWLVRDTRFVWIIVPITLAYVYGKTVGPGALTSIVDYHPEFSIKRVLEFQGGSIADLLCLNWPVGGASIAIFWLVATLLAVVVRQRLVWFCWFWILLSPLPVEFLNRTGPSLYIPLAGWAIFASVVVAWLIDRVSALAVPQVRVAVTAGLVLLIVIPFARMGRDARRYRYKPEMAQQGLLSASVIAQLDALHPAIRPGSRVLFLNDPFHDYDMLFIAQLWANQRDTEFKLNRLEPVPADEQGKYDSIFRFDDGKLVQLK